MVRKNKSGPILVRVWSNRKATGCRGSEEGCEDKFEGVSRCAQVACARIGCVGCQGRRPQRPSIAATRHEVLRTILSSGRPWLQTKLIINVSVRYWVLFPCVGICPLANDAMSWWALAYWWAWTRKCGSLDFFFFRTYPDILELPCEVSNSFVSFCRGTHWDFGSDCTESTDPSRDN